MKNILFILKLSIFFVLTLVIIHMVYLKLIVPHLDAFLKYKNILIFFLGILPVELIFFTFLRKNPTLVNSLAIVLVTTVITQAYIYLCSHMAIRPFLKSSAVENVSYFVSSGSLIIFLSFIILMIPTFVLLIALNKTKI